MMQSVSSNNQVHPIAGDETTNFSDYSSSVHKSIFMINTVIFGLIQLMNAHSPVLETHKASILCFFVLLLGYAVFLVWEDSAIRAKVTFGRLVGCVSHLFGGLAGLVLISIICAPFALIVLILWFIWLCIVVYYILKENRINHVADRSGINSPSPSSV